MREYICIYDEDEMQFIPSPYADTEELIRCKDCKKRKQCKVATEYYYCDMTGAIVGVSEFCSWAERKEE